MKKLYWKYLLGVFKIKRIVARWYGTRALDYARHPLRIMTSTLREYHTRARSVAKEPDTVRWLEHNARGTLYDVGANIGAYSLIAAALGSKVFAFEPGSYNVGALEANAALNKLAGMITAMPFALGEATKLGTFTVMDATPGSSRGFYNEAGNFHLSTAGASTHEVAVMSLDDCVKIFKLPPPTALKIDVDGGELEVLSGAAETLRNPTLTSVLVEAGEGRAEAVSAILVTAGFRPADGVRLDKRTENLLFER
jgi:FkbM family methyltransferase